MKTIKWIYYFAPFLILDKKCSFSDKNAPFLDMEKVILKNSCFLTTESRMGEMEAARPLSIISFYLLLLNPKQGT